MSASCELSKWAMGTKPKDLGQLPKIPRPLAGEGKWRSGYMFFAAAVPRVRVQRALASRVPSIF